MPDKNTQSDNSSTRKEIGLIRIVMAKKGNIDTLSSSAPSAERIEVWHKTTCSKSCEVISLLKEHKVTPDIFLYTETPPTEEAIKKVLKKLGIKAAELIRKKEKIYKEKFEGKKMSEEKWIKAMVKFPILIERPIVIKGNKAVIGRPTEKILEIL